MDLNAELIAKSFPSKWSKRYSPEEVLQKHCEFVTKASQETRNEVKCELDVPYGNLERQKMDIFGTDLPNDSPILIHIHGGYWQELNKDVSSYMVKPLVKQKIKVIVLGHTLCPQVTLAEIVEEIERAVLYCLEYATNNNSRAIYMSGHSAGAHLIASLFSSFFGSLTVKQRSLIKNLFMICGKYDLTPLIKTSVNNALKLDEETAIKLSPLKQTFQPMDYSFPVKAHVIVGENDSPTFKNQSKLFHEKLSKVGYNSEFIMVPEVDHFDIVELLADENYEIVKLIANENNKI